MKGFSPHPKDFDIALRVKELRKHNVVGVSNAAKDLWDALEPILDSAAAMPAAETDDNPFATADEKEEMTAASEMREWSDKTGAFKVEARFIKIDGTKVVLLRKDGEELTLPISRLSTADQKIVEGLRASK